jgi:hypothetical protein
MVAVLISQSVVRLPVVDPGVVDVGDGEADAAEAGSALVGDPDSVGVPDRRASSEAGNGTR